MGYEDSDDFRLYREQDFSNTVANVRVNENKK